MSGKRTDYISWDEYFMGVAMLSGMRSKDPNTQVGCCIVSQENKILSMGYNGLPIGCDDDDFPWEREGDPLETKYLFTAHSELNAILNYGGGNLRGAKLYVSSVQLFATPWAAARQASQFLTTFRVCPSSCPLSW